MLATLYNESGDDSDIMNIDTDELLSSDSEDEVGLYMVLRGFPEERLTVPKSPLSIF